MAKVDLLQWNGGYEHVTALSCQQTQFAVYWRVILVMGKKRKNDDEEFEFDPAPKHLAAPGHIRNQEKRLIIVLEKAQLETVKVSYF